MDDELGAQPVVGLAQEQQQQIAEGNATEPVVDGIGTDNPTQLNQPMLGWTLALGSARRVVDLFQ